MMNFIYAQNVLRKEIIKSYNKMGFLKTKNFEIIKSDKGMNPKVRLSFENTNYKSNDKCSKCNQGKLLSVFLRDNCYYNIMNQLGDEKFLIEIDNEKNIKKLYHWGLICNQCSFCIVQEKKDKVKNFNEHKKLCKEEGMDIDPIVRKQFSE
jgi:hypothetical protein